MPLNDHFPVIDDRSFTDLVAEARSRIPRYTSEWTDLNDNDPGMALVQLFAWMTELQIFRLGQVPELNYLKFLELIGMELEPAQPARGWVTLPVEPGHPEEQVLIPQGAQIASADADQQGPVLFETDRALTAIRAQLVALQSFDGFTYRELSAANDAADGDYQPFGPRLGEGAALYLGFSEALPAVAWSLVLYRQSAQAGRLVLSCAEPQPGPAAGVFAWEYWDGASWAALTVLGDDTAGWQRGGELRFRGPSAGSMQPRAIGRVDAPLFWVRAVPAAGWFQRAPEIVALRTNTVAVTQAETLRFENLGGSNGEMDQVLVLQDAPVLPGTLALEVDEGAGYLPWEEVDDFAGSDPDAAHYVLNRATGEVRFGNGRRGRIPVANATRPLNVRARSYRVGGGKRGNLAAGELSVLQDALAGIAADRIANLLAISGGTDEETVAEARKRAPLALKSRERAVTPEDFELLARQSADVARARALPLHHPDHPHLPVPGAVTVVVVPDTEDPAPQPVAATLQAVCAYLNERRLLTTEVYVTGPRYVPVVVHVEFVADPRVDLAAVKTRALADLQLYLHPLFGGEDSKADLDPADPAARGSGWPFGGALYYSLLYQRLLKQSERLLAGQGAGLLRIERLRFWIDGEPVAECRDGLVPDGVLLRGGEHQVDVRYAEAGGR